MEETTDVTFEEIKALRLIFTGKKNDDFLDLIIQAYLLGKQSAQSDCLLTVRGS